MGNFSDNSTIEQYYRKLFDASIHLLETGVLESDFTMMVICAIENNWTSLGPQLALCLLKRTINASFHISKFEVACGMLMMTLAHSSQNGYLILRNPLDSAIDDELALGLDKGF